MLQKISPYPKAVTSNVRFGRPALFSEGGKFKAFTGPYATTRDQDRMETFKDMFCFVYEQKNIPWWRPLKQLTSKLWRNMEMAADMKRMERHVDMFRLPPLAEGEGNEYPFQAVYRFDSREAARKAWETIQEASRVHGGKFPFPAPKGAIWRAASPPGGKSDGSGGRPKYETRPNEILVAFTFKRAPVAPGKKRG